MSLGALLEPDWVWSPRIISDHEQEPANHFDRFWLL
jgi:hypothetical protein